MRKNLDATPALKAPEADLAKVFVSLASYVVLNSNVSESGLVKMASHGCLEKIRKRLKKHAIAANRPPI